MSTGKSAFQFHNRAYEEAFGLRREQIQNRTMLDVLGPQLYDQVKGHVGEALAGIRCATSASCHPSAASGANTS
jgi:PAS domain S-box-containing protein